MQQHSARSLTIATGLAMFSMFFGAGNVVFPLALGRVAQEYTIWAMLGLGLTGVLMPFFGVMSLALYQGSYNRFFGRLGQLPSALLILACMLLIGPAAAAPRTITVAHATVALYVPWLSLPLFSALFCLIVFLMTWRPTRIIDLLGYVLTPILLVSLAVIIIKGLWGAPPMGPAPGSRMDLFFSGWLEGYQTMDMIAALFFSHVALVCLKKEVPEEIANDDRKMLGLLFKSSMVGAVCLGAIYGGVSFLTACHGATYQGVGEEVLLGTIAQDQLGIIGGLIACVAVTFACLTTAIALASVFAEYLQKTIFRERVGYVPSLVLTLLVTFVISTFGFSGIKAVVIPILSPTYPALIVLCIVNMGHKLYGWQSAHLPFWLTLAASLAYNWVAV